MNMKTLVAVAGLALTMTAGAAAANVTGTWTMAVTGGPHGDAKMGLVLKQEGTKVTGTFAMSDTAPEIAVAGDFVDGALKIETTQGDPNQKITFNAKLKDDGTLAGYVSSEMGDMKWTASRAADKKAKK
jgi:hypothetical protein